MASRILLVGLLLLCAAPSGAFSFQVITTNFFAGASDVSADGSAVVAVSVGAEGDGSIYRRQGGVNTLVASGCAFISGGGVSADGSVVTGGRSVGCSGPQEAFRWQNGSLVVLGSGTSSALDISADASTIVGYGSSGAFMHQGGVVTYLPDLPGGGTTAYAWGVSGDGSVIVGQGTSSSGTEAFRWQAGVMTGLGDLAGGTFESKAFDITLDGSVVVGKGTGASGGEAFRWEGGVITGLGQLGGVPTIAYAVTADGSRIVGTAYDSNAYNGVATIWDAQHGMRDLKAVLQQEFGLDLSAYVLTSADGISSDGLTIAGSGRSLSTGQQIGWMVTIPEPATLPLLALGVLGLAVRRRRG